METCSGCNLAKYCSRFCQHKDWDGHHKVCGISTGNGLHSTGSGSNNTNLSALYNSKILLSPPLCVNSGKVTFTHNIYVYSQTWANDQLRIATTCLQQPLFWGPIFNFQNIKVPLNNNHLSTAATTFGSRGWWLYTDLTVLIFRIALHFFKSLPCSTNQLTKARS